jgi:predicted transcriptional regulator of viral defense system
MASTDIDSTSLLLEIAARGPFRARDLEVAGIPRVYLSRLSDRGLLERVSRGLYRLADSEVSELSSLAEVSKRVPHATICLLSALQVHEMTSELPHAVWIMIDRHARPPKLNSRHVEIVYASGAALTHGVHAHQIEGVSVNVTTPAKTVADCFRYRRHVGLDVAIASLKEYLTRRIASVDELVAAARTDRIYAFMRPYMEALL